MTALSAPCTTSRDLDLGNFRTTNGEVLENARLRYRIYGDPEAGRTLGWVLVFHALTGSQNVDQWWGPLLQPGKPLDPARRPVLAANLLGSCYGSSGPGPADGHGTRQFPALTTADLARAHDTLLAHLGIERVALATGGSLGGMVALQWARMTAVPADAVVVFAAPAATSAQAIAWNAAQRLAIEADPAWRGGHYPPGTGPAAGLAAARAIAMITYRSAVEFDTRFGRQTTRGDSAFDVEHYLRRQGDKLVARFDAASYVALMQAMDLHDVGDLEQSAQDTGSRVRRIVGVGIDSDILYYPEEVEQWVRAYRAAGVNAEYRLITTPYGHDAFLIEWGQVEAVLEESLGFGHS